MGGISERERATKKYTQYRQIESKQALTEAERDRQSDSLEAINETEKCSQTGPDSQAARQTERHNDDTILIARICSSQDQTRAWGTETFSAMQRTSVREGRRLHSRTAESPR